MIWIPYTQPVRYSIMLGYSPKMHSVIRLILQRRIPNSEPAGYTNVIMQTENPTLSQLDTGMQLVIHVCICWRFTYHLAIDIRFRVLLNGQCPISNTQPDLRIYMGYHKKVTVLQSGNFQKY